MAYTQLIPRHTPGAQVDEVSYNSAHYRLSIPSGFADSYRLAQLDDYTKISRRGFPHRFPLKLNLFARTSSDAIAGTWGFGLWNDPFGLSLGFGGNPFRLPALPNAAWFFGASEENYLSFRSPLAHQKHQDYSERSGKSTSRSEDEAQIYDVAHASSSPPANGGSALRELPSSGFLAQTFRAPKFHPSLILAGLALPFSRITTRRLLGRVIEEDAINLSSRRSLAPTDAQHLPRTQVPGESTSYTEKFDVDPTLWHRYRLEWREKRVSFEVDNIQVFESLVSPNPPLGLVIWIDNQYAAFTPEGKIGFGVLANPEPTWLEVKEIELS